MGQASCVEYFMLVYIQAIPAEHFAGAAGT